MSDPATIALTEAQKRAVINCRGPHAVVTSPEIEPLWWFIRKDAPDDFFVRFTREGLELRAHLLKDNSHES